MAKFLILAEGETEVRYIQELVQYFWCQGMGQVRKAKGTNPMRIVREAVTEMYWSSLSEKAPYDKCFVVFDQDRHADYIRAIQIASSAKNVEVIWSNPNLEAWFLMHFVDIQKVLPLDSDYSLSTETTVREENDIRETTTVERTRPIVSPKTAVQLLRRVWKGYRKNSPESYLDILKERLGTALSTVHNTEDPEQPGSRFGVLLRYFMEIGVVPKEAETHLNSGEPAASFEEAVPMRLTLRSCGGRMAMPRMFYERFERMFGEAAIASHEDAQSDFKTVQTFLERFPFLNGNQVTMAHILLLTAALGKYMEHTPFLILNCRGTGRSKEYFEDVLCRLAAPKKVLRADFPETGAQSEELALTDADYIVLKARGRLRKFSWFANRWDAKKSPIVVIIGNNLDISEFQNSSVEVLFKTSRTPAPYSDEELTERIPRMRDTLRLMSFYCCQQGNPLVKPGVIRPLLCWRCFCPMVLTSLGIRIPVNPIRQDL